MQPFRIASAPFRLRRDMALRRYRRHRLARARVPPPGPLLRQRGRPFFSFKKDYVFIHCRPPGKPPRLTKETRMLPFEIREYCDDRGICPFSEWFNQLDAKAAARVDRHIRRMENGNFGWSKPVGGGVHELKTDIGPGYRVYYGRDGQRRIILLAGGSKRRQTVDIQTARRRWNAYLAMRRTHGTDPKI